MVSSNNNIFEKHPLTMYFVLSFAISWLIFSPGVAANIGLIDFGFDGTVLTILGGLGPFIAATVVTGATDGTPGIRKMFNSMFNLKIKAKWWAAATLLAAGLFTLSALINNFMGDQLRIKDQGCILMAEILAWSSSSCFSGQSLKNLAGVDLPTLSFSKCEAH